MARTRSKSGVAALSIAMTVCAAPPVQSSEIESHQDVVVECLSKIETDADWAECRTVMFENCAGKVIGGSDHIQCLMQEHAAWENHLDAYLALLNRKLTTNGAAALADFSGQWYSYRENRCNAVAEERAAIGFNPEAAGFGCMIAETAGIVTDLDRCLDGKSNAPYCTIRE